METTTEEAYFEGREAARHWGRLTCPYFRSNLRRAWHTGYSDARIGCPIRDRADPLRRGMPALVKA